MQVGSCATTDGWSWPADAQAQPAVSSLVVEKPLNELCRVHVITGTRCGNPFVQGLMQRSTFLVREAAAKTFVSRRKVDMARVGLGYISWMRTSRPGDGSRSGRSNPS
jgi:hypothetical protein